MFCKSQALACFELKACDANVQIQSEFSNNISAKKCRLFSHILIILFLNYIKTDATSSLNIHVEWYEIAKTSFIILQSSFSINYPIKHTVTTKHKLLTREHNT